MLPGEGDRREPEEACVSMAAVWSPARTHCYLLTYYLKKYLLERQSYREREIFKKKLLRSLGE